jgi:hypothetical protein
MTRKQFVYSLLFLCGLGVGILFIHAQQELLARKQQALSQVIQDSGTPRRTVIIAPGGEPLTEITEQNATSSNGVMTITPSILDEEVLFLYNSMTSLPVRFKNTSGILMYQNYGEDWAEVGSGSGGSLEYGLDDNGTGTMATTTISASTLKPVFFKTNWHWSAAMVIDTLQTCTLWDFINSEYSAVRLRVGIDASNQLYVTVGTDLGGTPATTTYTYTSQSLGAQETGVPIQIDVSYDGTNDEVTFCVNGTCGAVVAAVTDFDNYTGVGTTDTVNLGSSVDGRIMFMAFGDNDVFPASSWKGITKEGSYPHCAAQWNFDEGEGTALGDVCGSIDLTCDAGDWIEVPGGY